MSGLIVKFRKGPLSRWGIYWRQLGQDYADAFSDTAKEAKNHPIKATIYILGGATLVYGWNTSPDERQFSDQLVAADGRLRLLAPQLRNPAAEQRVRRLRRLQADGRLRTINLGPLSVLWELPFPAGTALHAAQCSYLQPSYLTFYERVLDVGAFGRWWGLWASMMNYDVNDELFEESGAGKSDQSEAVVGSAVVS